ncbi:MAG: hypothetical protein ACREIK_07640 [Nitrospiraceae bacterium]
MTRTSRILRGGAVALALGLGMSACGEGGSSSPITPSPKTTVSRSSGSSVPDPPTDSSKGPTFRTVSGKVVQIKGAYYDVEEPTGDRVRLHVNQETVMLKGDKKVGDKIRAEVTSGGHANSIQ